MHLLNRLIDSAGLNPAPDYDDYDDEYNSIEQRDYQQLYQEDHATPPLPNSSPNRAPSSNRWASTTHSESGKPFLTPVGSAKDASEVVILQPHSFGEMPFAIQLLKQRKSIVLNLALLEPDQAQRVIDFIAGATFAMDGHQERIGEQIFLFTPPCVQINTSHDAMHPARPLVSTVGYSDPSDFQPFSIHRP